jgi:hypothetical protein
MHEVYPKPGDQSWKPGRGSHSLADVANCADDTHRGKATGKVGWDQNRIVSRKEQPGPELPAPTSGAAEGEINGVIFIYGGEEPSFIDGGINDRHWMFDTRAASP